MSFSENIYPIICYLMYGFIYIKLVFHRALTVCQAIYVLFCTSDDALIVRNTRILSLFKI
jgi:hypothetical protein